MDIFNIVPESLEPFDGLSNEVDRLVCRIVEHLDFKLVFWVLDGADRLDDAFDNIELIIHGKLHGHDGLTLQRRQSRFLPAVLQVVIDHHESVGPEREENEKREKIEIQDHVREERTVKDFLSKEHRCNDHDRFTILLLFH